MESMPVQQQQPGHGLGHLVDEAKGKSYPLNKQMMIIGRDRNADIRFIHAEVSRNHGYVKVDEANQKVTIQQVSRTVILVNAKELGQDKVHVLQPNDRIEFPLLKGQNRSLVYLPEGASLPTPRLPLANLDNSRKPGAGAEQTPARARRAKDEETDEDEDNMPIMSLSHKKSSARKRNSSASSHMASAGKVARASVAHRDRLTVLAKGNPPESTETDAKQNVSMSKRAPEPYLESRCGGSAAPVHGAEAVADEGQALKAVTKIGESLERQQETARTPTLPAQPAPDAPLDPDPEVLAEAALNSSQEAVRVQSTASAPAYEDRVGCNAEETQAEQTTRLSADVPQEPQQPLDKAHGVAENIESAQTVATPPGSATAAPGAMACARPEASRTPAPSSASRPPLRSALKKNTSIRAGSPVHRASDWRDTPALRKGIMARSSTATQAAKRSDTPMLKLPLSASKSPYSRPPWRSGTALYGRQQQGTGQRSSASAGRQASARAQRMVAGAKDAASRTAALRGSATSIAASGTPEGIAVDVLGGTPMPPRAPANTGVPFAVCATTPALREWAFGEASEHDGTSAPPSTVKKVRFSLDFEASAAAGRALHQAPGPEEAPPGLSPGKLGSTDHGPLAPSCTPLSAAPPGRRSAQTPALDLQLVAAKLDTLAEAEVWEDAEKSLPMLSQEESATEAVAASSDALAHSRVDSGPGQIPLQTTAASTKEMPEQAPRAPVNDVTKVCSSQPSGNLPLERGKPKAGGDAQGSQSLVSNPLYGEVAEAEELDSEAAEPGDCDLETEQQLDEASPVPPLQDILDLVSKVDAACGTTPVAVRHESEGATGSRIAHQAQRRQLHRKMAAAQASQLQVQLHRTANNAILLKKNLAKAKAALKKETAARLELERRLASLENSHAIDMQHGGNGSLQWHTSIPLVQRIDAALSPIPLPPVETIPCDSSTLLTTMQLAPILASTATETTPPPKPLNAATETEDALLSMSITAIPSTCANFPPTVVQAHCGTSPRAFEDAACMTSPGKKPLLCIAAMSPISSEVKNAETATTPGLTAQAETATTPPPQKANKETETTPPPQTANAETATTPPPQTANMDTATTPPPQTANMETATTPPPQTANMQTATTPLPSTVDVCCDCELLKDVEYHEPITNVAEVSEAPAAEACKSIIAAEQVEEPPVSSQQPAQGMEHSAHAEAGAALDAVTEDAPTVNESAARLGSGSAHDAGEAPSPAKNRSCNEAADPDTNRSVSITPQTAGPSQPCTQMPTRRRSAISVNSHPRTSRRSAAILAAAQAAASGPTAPASSSAMAPMLSGNLPPPASASKPAASVEKAGLLPATEQGSRSRRPTSRGAKLRDAALSSSLKTVAATPHLNKSDDATTAVKVSEPPTDVASLRKPRRSSTVVAVSKAPTGHNGSIDKEQSPRDLHIELAAVEGETARKPDQQEQSCDKNEGYKTKDSSKVQEEAGTGCEEASHELEAVGIEAPASGKDCREACEGADSMASKPVSVPGAEEPETMKRRSRRRTSSLCTSAGSSKQKVAKQMTAALPELPEHDLSVQDQSVSCTEAAEAAPEKDHVSEEMKMDGTQAKRTSKRKEPQPIASKDAVPSHSKRTISSGDVPSDKAPEAEPANAASDHPSRPSRASNRKTRAKIEAQTLDQEPAPDGPKELEVPQPKKGRGRPRKQKAPTADETEAEDQAARIEKASTRQMQTRGRSCRGNPAVQEEEPADQAKKVKAKGLRAAQESSEAPQTESQAQAPPRRSSRRRSKAT